MSIVATVLYEDKIAAGAKEFALHTLVLTMAGEQLGRSLWELRPLVFGNPRNGVDNVLKDIQRRTARLAGAGRLFALIDRDRIAGHLGLPKATSDDVLVRRIKEKSDAPDRLEVFFLHENLEDVLADAQTCGGPVAPAKKRPLARDTCLNFMAFRAPRSVRDCLGDEQPGLGALVKALCASLGEPSGR